MGPKKFPDQTRPIFLFSLRKIEFDIFFWLLSKLIRSEDDNSIAEIMLQTESYANSNIITSRMHRMVWVKYLNSSGSIKSFYRIIS